MLFIALKSEKLLSSLKQHMRNELSKQEIYSSTLFVYQQSFAYDHWVNAHMAIK
jgi:hypothetical protein